MEHIVSFPPGRIPDEDRFCCEMTGITYPDRNYRVQRPKSGIYCLEYVIKGTGIVLCEDITFRPQSGDVYLLPSGVRQNYRSAPEDPLEKIWINMRGSLCDALYELYGLSGTYLFRQKPLRPLFQSFLKLCEDNYANPRYISIRGALIVHEILAALSEPQKVGDDLEPRYVSNAKEYIDLNISQQLNINDVAAHVGVSVSQLNRAFARRYGVSPYKYYMDLRMNTACSLLRNTGLQIQEISRRLQFRDVHYFSTAFKAYAGMSPKVYRRKGIED